MAQLKIFILITSALVVSLSFYFAQSSPVRDVKISEHSVVLVVAYDGFRYDYFDLIDTPVLNSLRRNGTTVPYMEPVYPTFTFPNFHSVATGLYPETHGVVDNLVFDPIYNRTLNGFEEDPLFWNYDPAVLPFWIWNEMMGEGRTSGCLMWPGSSPAYGAESNLLPHYHPPVYNLSIPWENLVDDAISWITNPTRPANLVYMYIEEPDLKGHAFGPNSPELYEEVQRVDQRTAYLVDKLKETGIFDKINLIFLTDHGMQMVMKKDIINITALVDPELVERKHGGTPMIHFTPKEGRAQELYDVLESQSRMLNFTVWKKEEMRDPYYYTESRRVMDFVVAADPGWAFDDFRRTAKGYDTKWNFKANETREYGVHGYSNTHLVMKPFFFAHGPAFKKNYEHGIIKNVDVVPLISKILGIREPANNGSLERVMGMIDEEFLNKRVEMNVRLWENDNFFAS